MPKSTRATQTLIDEVTKDVTRGHYLVAQKKLLDLPKKEAVVATAYVIEALAYDHRFPLIEQFLDSLLFK